MSRQSLEAPVPFAGVAFDPATDPFFFADVVNDLRDHRGEWRHPGRAVLASRDGECDSAVLSKATGRVVEFMRHVGDVVDGDRALGYRYMGPRRKYVRVTQLEAFDVFEEAV